MREFRVLLESMKNLDETLAGFMALNKENKLKAHRLKLLLSNCNQMEGGLLPENYKEVVEQFESLIVWKKAPGHKPGIGCEIVMPKPGIDEELD